MSGKDTMPCMDELLGGTSRPTVKPAPAPAQLEDPRGKLERTSMQVYTNHRDNLAALAFYKRVNNYDVLAEALDEYFTRNVDELQEAKELQQGRKIIKRGRPRRT